VQLTGRAGGHAGPSRTRRVVELLAIAVAGGLALSCGASIQAVYEGNVRFEHCMALDSRPDVKPTLRRACWEEWDRFYTFGQTRDRVEYARMRREQLVGASDFDEGDWAPKTRVADAVPEPTSAAAPPPMLLTPDGGASQPAPSSEPRAPEKPPTNAECTTTCDGAWSVCRGDCKTSVCEKTCQSKYKRCMKSCF
jgi:hypothetical protein